MKRIIFGLLSLFCLLVVSVTYAGGPDLPAPASENASGVYIGAGMAFEDTINERFDDSITSTEPPMPVTLHQANYSFGPTGYIGYMFSARWAIEADFTWLRDTRYNLTAPNSDPSIGFACVSQKYLAYLVGIRKFPIRDYFAFFIKAGGGWYHKREAVTIPGAALLSTLNAFVFIYGAGLEFPIHNAAGIRVQYTGLVYANHLDPFHFVPNYLSVDFYVKFS